MPVAVGADVGATPWLGDPGSKVGEESVGWGLGRRGG